MVVGVVMLAAIGGLIFALLRAPGLRQITAKPAHVLLVEAADAGELDESFAGPALGAGWSTLGAAGEFNGSGQYVIRGNEAHSHNGARRSLPRGDTTIAMKLTDLQWTGGGVVTAAVWDDATNGLLLRLHHEPQRTWLSIEYHDGSRIETIHCQHDLAGAPTAADFRMAWVESNRQWHVAFGFNGDAPHTPAAEGPITRYKSESTDRRRLDVYVEAADSGGPVSASLDAFSVTPVAQVELLTPEAAEPERSDSAAAAAWPDAGLPDAPGAVKAEEAAVSPPQAPQER